MIDTFSDYNKDLTATVEYADDELNEVSTHEDEQYHHDNINSAVAEYCLFAAGPRCRLLFVDQRMRYHRHKFMTTIVSHYCGCCKNPATIAIKKAFRKIDICDVISYAHRMNEYWALTHEEVIIGAMFDVSYDQLTALFE